MAIIFDRLGVTDVTMHSGLHGETGEAGISLLGGLSPGAVTELLLRTSGDRGWLRRHHVATKLSRSTRQSVFIVPSVPWSNRQSTVTRSR